MPKEAKQGREKKKARDKANKKEEIDAFVAEVAEASKTSDNCTADVRLFGRMTTSDLVVNVEAACQVAHALSTHEAMIESDYFTAMDDKKSEFARSQTEQAGAAFLGSGEQQTFFNSAVYYKYLNVDVDALMRAGPVGPGVETVVAALLKAAALATPTGKQNSFASHGLPELMLVELSRERRPMSYANAFLQAVEGRNLMTESAAALERYIAGAARAFEPAGMEREVLAVGHAAAFALEGATKHETLSALLEGVSDRVRTGAVRESQP